MSRNRLLVLMMLVPLAAACGDDGEGTGGSGGGGGSGGSGGSGGVDGGGTGGTGGATATCFDESEFFRAAARNNTFDEDPQLGAPVNTAEPDFAPAADSPVLTGGATPPAPFDTSATYIGAIGAEDWTAQWTAYPVDTSGPNRGTVVEIAAGDITEDTTWSSDNTYVLQGLVFVKNATLTIEAGTLVRGAPASALIITNTARLDAQGTAANPIVFTSNKDTGALAGDWGGVVLLGKAPINIDGGVNYIEGLEVGPDSEYGGTEDTHDCGTLRYVRIEYAGFEAFVDNELNGLTLGGCGSETELDFIQAHRGLDDGIEFFGGTASLRHGVITLAQDDSLDWDQGWTGTVQWLIAQQDATNGDNAFESDSNENNFEATPRSNPTLWNVTLIGSNADGMGRGMLLRRGTGATVRNSIIAYFGVAAIDIGDASTAQQTEEGNLTVSDSYFFNNAGGEHWPADFDGAGADENDCP